MQHLEKREKYMRLATFFFSSRGEGGGGEILFFPLIWVIFLKFHDFSFKTGNFFLQTCLISKEAEYSRL